MGPGEHFPYNRHGGLTLIAAPNFEQLGREIQDLIQKIAHSKEKPTPIDLITPVFALRANNEPVVQLAKDHIGGHDCVVITSGPGTPEMQTQLFYLLGVLKGRRPQRITVVSGYMPLSRSDKDEGTLELALAPHFVHLLKEAAYDELDRIITFDLHSAQGTMASGEMGLITEVSIVRRVIRKAIEEAQVCSDSICVLFPDEGSHKRFEDDLDKVCNDLDIALPRVYGTKRRKDDLKMRLLGLHGEVDKLNGALVISIDDEIATASTNIATAEIVKQDFQVKAFWAATVHGVLCGKAAEYLRYPLCPLDKVIITDSIPFEHRPHLQPLIEQNKIIVVPCVKDLAEIIFHHHWDMNIRERRG